MIEPQMMEVLKLFGFGRRDNPPSSESEDMSSDSECSSDQESEVEDVDVDEPNKTYCAVCMKKADLRCGRCRNEFYCSKQHQTSDWKNQHKKFCVLAGKANGNTEDPLPPEIQNSTLLKLPWYEICKYLQIRDLIHLGQVCRSLRHIARDPKSWSHTKFTDSSCELPRKGGSFSNNYNYGYIGVAPAFNTIRVSYSWPPVNFLRFTKNVKVFEVDWEVKTMEEYNLEKVIRVLEHYKGHLEVLKLGYLTDLRLLKVIDRLGIKELYVDGTLLKTYPGSSKVVTEMKIGREVSGEVLANALHHCRKTLKTFRVDSYYLDKNPWAHAQNSPVRPALKKCQNLERITTKTMGKATLLNSFPKLKKLCIFDLEDDNHAFTKEFFIASPVMKKVESLTLHLGYQGHRGMIMAAAMGCPSVKEFRLMFRSVDKMNLSVTVDVPRDLPKILARMKYLETLVLSIARVPFTVFCAIGNGALPNLRVLKLRFCGGTTKAVKALKELRAKRKDLKVLGEELQPARRKMVEDEGNRFVIPAWQAPPSGSRCDDPLCLAPSDSDESDPIVEPRGSCRNGHAMHTTYAFDCLNDTDSD